MRRFVLVRDHDVSEISGEGVVVWGVQFPDGFCAYRWATAWRTTTIAESIEDVLAIHGHGGATRVVWLDTEEGAQTWTHAGRRQAGETIVIRPDTDPDPAPGPAPEPPAGRLVGRAPTAG